MWGDVGVTFALEKWSSCVVCAVVSSASAGDCACVLIRMFSSCCDAPEDSTGEAETVAGALVALCDPEEEARTWSMAQATSGSHSCPAGVSGGEAQTFSTLPDHLLPQKGHCWSLVTPLGGLQSTVDVLPSHAGSQALCVTTQPPLLV